MLMLTLQAYILHFAMGSGVTETTTFTFVFCGGYGFGITPVSHSSTSDRSNLSK